MKQNTAYPENKYKTVKVLFSDTVINDCVKSTLETKSGKILVAFPAWLGEMRCIFADRKGNSIVCSDYSKGNSVPFLIVNGNILVDGYAAVNEEYDGLYAFRPASPDGSIWQSGKRKFKINPAIYTKEERACLSECFDNLSGWRFTGIKDK